MPIYTISRRPDEISDLIHWFDAADLSTINTGTSDVNLPTVLTLKDKVSTMTLSADLHGDPPILIGPTGDLNEKHGISFSGHPGKGTLSGVFTDTSFNSKKTIFFVFVTQPFIDPQFNNFKFSILNSDNPLLMGTLGGWPNISLYTNQDKMYYLETGLMTLPTIQYGTIPSKKVNIVSISISQDIVKTERINTNTSKYLYRNPNGISLTTGSKLILGDVTDVTYIVDPSTKPFANQLDNTFCEMLIYDRALIEEEVNKINQYLKTKWIG